jgi:hypothetical protein
VSRRRPSRRPDRCRSRSPPASPSRSRRGSEALATLARRRRRPGLPRDDLGFRACPRNAPQQPSRYWARQSAPSHACARPELNIGLAFDPATADALQRGARQAELIETEVALRKRLEAGISKRVSRRTRIRTAPASTRSNSMPGNKCSSARQPPATSRCVCRACGVPKRGAGTSRKTSRSNMVTFRNGERRLSRQQGPPSPHQ